MSTPSAASFSPRASMDVSSAQLVKSHTPNTNRYSSPGPIPLNCEDSDPDTPQQAHLPTSALANLKNTNGNNSTMGSGKDGPAAISTSNSKLGVTSMDKLDISGLVPNLGFVCFNPLSVILRLVLVATTYTA